MEKRELKCNIIIPQDKDFSVSSKSRKEILENLKSITSEEIDTIWKAVNQIKNSKKEVPAKGENKTIKNNERPSEEHLMAIREFILRIWLKLSYENPLTFVNWEPIFLWRSESKKKWYVFFGYNIIWKNLDNLYSFKNSNKTTSGLVYDFNGTPILIWIRGDDYFIINWDVEIKINEFDLDILDLEGIEPIIDKYLYNF